MLKTNLCPLCFTSLTVAPKLVIFHKPPGQGEATIGREILSAAKNLRGITSPKGFMQVTESGIIEQISFTLNRPAKQLRETITVGLLKSARIIRSNYAALFR
jgi:hypothetical protein